MNSDTIEMYYSDTTDLEAVRCSECGSIDFEYTSTRKFCVRCGLVLYKSYYLTASTYLGEMECAGQTSAGHIFQAGIEVGADAMLEGLKKQLGSQYKGMMAPLSMAIRKPYNELLTTKPGYLVFIPEE